MVEVCTIFIICLEVYESIHLDRRINELEKEIKRVQMGFDQDGRRLVAEGLRLTGVEIFRD